MHSAQCGTLHTAQGTALHSAHCMHHTGIYLPTDSAFSNLYEKYMSTQSAECCFWDGTVPACNTHTGTYSLYRLGYRYGKLIPLHESPDSTT